jgi:uncharacterized protein YoxC
MKTQSALLYEVAERLSHVKTIQEKSLIISKMFGRGGGKNMLNFFGGGVEQIKIAENAFKKFGYTLKKDDIKNSEDFNRTLKYLGMAAEGAKNKIGYALIPTLNKWGEAILNAQDKHNGLKAQIHSVLEEAKTTYPRITAYIDNMVDHTNIAIETAKKLFDVLQIKQASKNILAGAVEGAQDYQYMFDTLSDKLSESRFGKGFDKMLGVDTLSNKVKPNITNAFNQKATKESGVSKNRQVVINNTPTFNFTIPAGTAESQQAWFKNAASDFADNAIQKESKNILMAFPQYEGA